MPQRFFLAALNSPFGIQLFTVSFLLAFFLAFQPPYAWFSSEWESFRPIDSANDLFLIETPGFLKNTVGVNTAGLQRNEDGGVMTKSRRNEALKYTVKPGDNITRIAHRFGLEVKTILWANELTSRQTIAPNTELRIPPVDGVYYQVQKYETLSEIAKNHDLASEKILVYNNIQNNTVKVDQELFLPGANRIYVKPKAAPPTPVAVARNTTQTTTPARTTTTTTSTNSNYGRYIAPSTSSSNGLSWNGTLIRPAHGVLTQGYRRGHYAIDIANSMNTPIYAAAGGTVEIAKVGGWNGGYGNYVVIDHGSGVKTLYSHNNVVKVRVGQKVQRGQIVALMGNTGRVFGRTGIHLHFELRINGRKYNPYNYF